MSTKIFLATVSLYILESCFALPCKAQKRVFVPGQAPYQKFNVNETIPATFTRSLALDSTGYLWIGATTGLVRYDGYEPVVYKIDKPGAADNIIRTLFVDSQNRIWVSTGRSGAYIFDQIRGKFIELFVFEKNERGRYKEGILKFTEDKWGNVWGHWGNRNREIYGRGF